MVYIKTYHFESSSSYMFWYFKGFKKSCDKKLCLRRIFQKCEDLYNFESTIYCEGNYTRYAFWVFYLHIWINQIYADVWVWEVFLANPFMKKRGIIVQMYLSLEQGFFFLENIRIFFFCHYDLLFFLDFFWNFWCLLSCGPIKCWRSLLGGHIDVEIKLYLLFIILKRIFGKDPLVFSIVCGQLKKGML